ncbi:MAG: DUF4186 domain-containing protein [Akkermansia sp.]|nr:DUF4186 domain-containing protein [Akkermansia sp.]
MIRRLPELMQSDFRRRFRLSVADVAYIRRVGMERIREHAADFVRQRLAPAMPQHDGRQTPMRGHPVFKAQHACGCCCRSCLEKWHRIPQGRALSAEEQAAVVELLMSWLQLKLSSEPPPERRRRGGPEQGMLPF